MITFPILLSLHLLASFLLSLALKYSSSSLVFVLLPSPLTVTDSIPHHHPPFLPFLSRFFTVPLWYEGTVLAYPGPSAASMHPAKRQPSSFSSLTTPPISRSASQHLAYPPTLINVFVISSSLNEPRICSTTEYNMRKLPIQSPRSTAIHLFLCNRPLSPHLIK